MKNLIRTSVLTLAVIFICQEVFTQNPQIGSFTIVMKDTFRHNRRITVDIYYPKAVTGESQEASGERSSKLPVICFGHGYLISGKWYGHITDILVPQGYILLFPAGESGMFPSHRTLALDMAFALNEISRIADDVSFPLHDRVDTVKCLMGHSMGGGSLFLAANQVSKLRAAIALAPYDTKPSAIKAAASVGAPTLIFSGSSDCITPPVKYHIPVYNSSASPDKTFIMIKGGTHCQMGVSHPKCRKGEKLAGCRNDGISQEEQLRIISKYISPWLKFFLKGDSEAGKEFDLEISRDTSVTYMRSRPLLSESD